MAHVSSPRACVLLLCVAAAALALVDAGGYRNGYKPPTRTAEELYMNYEAPAPLLKHHKARWLTAPPPLSRPRLFFNLPSLKPRVRVYLCMPLGSVQSLT